MAAALTQARCGIEKRQMRISRLDTSYTISMRASRANLCGLGSHWDRSSKAEDCDCRNPVVLVDSDARAAQETRGRSWSGLRYDACQECLVSPVWRQQMSGGLSVRGSSQRTLERAPRGHPGATAEPHSLGVLLPPDGLMEDGPVVTASVSACLTRSLAWGDRSRCFAHFFPQNVSRHTLDKRATQLAKRRDRVLREPA